MPSYLRFTPPPLEVSSVRPRLTVLVALGCLACGGAGPGKLAPQSPQETLAQFMSAVKANDLERSEEHTSELQSQSKLVCRLLLEKKKQCRGYPERGPDHARPGKPLHHRVHLSARPGDRARDRQCRGARRRRGEHDAADRSDVLVR